MNAFPGTRGFSLAISDQQSAGTSLDPVAGKSHSNAWHNRSSAAPAGSAGTVYQPVTSLRTAIL